MKILFVILVLSVMAVLVTVGAMWWRLRWHLRRSDDALKKTLAEIQPEHETAEAESAGPG
jgi:uncharacterized membrane protein YqjE